MCMGEYVYVHVCVCEACARHECSMARTHGVKLVTFIIRTGASAREAALPLVPMQREWACRATVAQSKASGCGRCLLEYHGWITLAVVEAIVALPAGIDPHIRLRCTAQTRVKRRVDESGAESDARRRWDGKRLSVQFLPQAASADRPVAARPPCQDASTLPRARPPGHIYEVWVTYYIYICTPCTQQPVRRCGNVLGAGHGMCTSLARCPLSPTLTAHCR